MPEPSLKDPALDLAKMQPANRRWWASKPEDRAKDMCATMENIVMNQKGRQAKMEIYARMYGGLSFMYGMKFSGVLSVGAAGNLTVAQSPRYNLGWSLVDTAKSIICKDDTRVTFLTSDADWGLQQRAKKLDEYVQGIFYQTGIYDVGEEVFGDSGIFGPGIMKVWHRNENIDIRRVFPNCVNVDVWDGADRRPRSIYESWIEDRDVLCGMFRNHKDYDDIRRRIMAAPSVTATGEYAMNATNNMVEVKEAFHLSADPTAPDQEEIDDDIRGRHVMCLADDAKTKLEDEPYDFDVFPYLVTRWNKLMVGWGGQGLCELLIGHQRELNRTLQVEATSHHIMSIPRVAAEISSRVNKNHMTSNKPGGIWWYQGTPPQALSWPAVSGDFVQWKEWIIQSAHDFTGISEMAAQAKKPLGLDSAVAQREFKDTQSDRLVMRQKAYDQMYVEAAQRIVNVARHLYKTKGSYPVNVVGKSTITQLDWTDVSLEDDEFKLKLWPTSMLPKTPAGRLQATQELIQAGFIDRDTGLRLLNFPDLEDVQTMLTAPQDQMKAVLDDIISKGKYRTPDPNWDLQYGIQQAKLLYLKTFEKGVPEERRNKLITWISAALAQQAQNAPPPPMAPPGGPPQAVPQASPVSQLLPNSQQQAA